MKNTFLSSRALAYDLGLLVLRLIAGVGILTHGWPKVQKVIEGNFQFGDPIGLGPEVSLILAAFAEGICSILLILGLVTRLALIPLIINMAVAFFIVHAGDDFGTKELSLLYLGMFVTLFLTGPGKISADQPLFK